jgi:hypothetical protein
MLNRYATAILGSLGTILVLTSYVAMYRNGTGAIYLGLLGFALIGSAMLVQRVRDLTLEVEDLVELREHSTTDDRYCGPDCGFLLGLGGCRDRNIT